MNHNHFSTGLQKAVRQLSKTEPLLWLADTVNSPQVRNLYPGAPGLFHAIDYFSGANRTTAVTLGRHVDMVLAATPLIAETFTQFAVPSCVFRNGWEFPDVDRNLPAPADLQAITGPRVGLVSFLSSNLDYGMLLQLVSALPISLVVIGRKIGDVGPDQHLLKALLSHPRVFYLGEKTTESLPAYINNFDVCIAPYKQNDRIYASDPLKIYQYLALGKSVVVTPVAVLESLVPMLDIAATSEDFNKAVASNLSRVTEPDLVERRRQFAASTQWDTRLRDLALSLSRCPRLAPLVERLGVV